MAQPKLAFTSHLTKSNRPQVFIFYVGYLMALSVFRLYSVDDKMMKTIIANRAMIIGRGD
jgi:hypothetical protein